MDGSQDVGRPGTATPGLAALRGRVACQRRAVNSHQDIADRRYAEPFVDAGTAGQGRYHSRIMATIADAARIALSLSDVTEGERHGKKRNSEP